MAKFIIEPHFRLQEWVAEEKGYFRGRGPRLRVQGVHPRHRRRPSRKGGKVGAFQSHREGPRGQRHLRLPLDRQCRRLARPHQALRRRLFGGAVRHLRAGRLADQIAEDLAGVPISVGYQSGSHYATIQALEPYLPRRQDQAVVRRGHAVRPHGALLEGKAPAAALFYGPYYFAEQLGFRKVIDSTFMIAAMINGDPDPDDIAQVFPRPAPRPARHRPAARALHALLQERVPRPLPCPHGHPPLGPRRAHRVRALHQGGVRKVLRLDRPARHLCRQRHGSGTIRRCNRVGCWALIHLARGPVRCKIRDHVAARDVLLAPAVDCRQYAPSIGSETNGEQRLGSSGQQRDGRSRRRFADHASHRAAGQDRDHADQAADHAARPVARLFAGRRRPLPRDLQGPGRRLRLHRARQPRGGDLQRHRRAGPGQSRRARPPSR